MKEKILTLSKEIFLSIQYGHYKVISIQEDDDWHNIKLRFTDYEILIGVDIESNLVIYYGLEVLSNRLTADEKKRICGEMEYYTSQKAELN